MSTPTEGAATDPAPPANNVQLGNGQPGDMFGAGGALSQDQLAKAGDQTRQLVAAAKSGGFTISAEGARSLRDVIADMRGKLRELQANPVLGQKPMLGAHPYGDTVATHDQNGAQQANGSAGVALAEFAKVLASADEALARAAGQYSEADQSTVGELPTAGAQA